MDLKSKLTNRQKGALLMCSSSFLFAAMQIPINLTSGQVPLMEQIFSRNIVSLIICLFIIKKSGGSFFGARKYQPLLFVRSIFGFMGFVTLFYAAGHAHQGDVNILMKLSPFMITILAAIFLKEKITRVQIPALIIATAGAAFVGNPAFSSNMLPLFMAFMCAVFSSVSYTLLAYFKNKVDGMTIVLHFSIVSVAITIPFMCHNFVMPGPELLAELLLIGIFGGLGQICLTYSYRMAPAAEISIYNYSGIVFAMLLGNICLGESLKWNSLIGGILVIIAAVLVYRYNNIETAGDCLCDSHAITPHDQQIDYKKDKENIN